ncbi:MAG: hypothetical protein ACRCZ9_12270 [Fusobacteriaceae bacterium]
MSQYQSNFSQTNNAIIPRSYGKMIVMEMTISYEEVKDFIGTAVRLPHTVEWKQIIPQAFFTKLVSEGKTKEDAANICSKLMMLPLYATDQMGNVLRNPNNTNEFLYFVETCQAPIVAPVVRFNKSAIVKKAANERNIYDIMSGSKTIDLELIKSACSRVVSTDDLPYREDKIDGTVDVFCNFLAIIMDMLGGYGLSRSSFGKDLDKWSIAVSSKPADQCIIAKISKNSYKKA